MAAARRLTVLATLRQDQAASEQQLSVGYSSESRISSGLGSRDRRNRRCDSTGPAAIFAES